jgi:hypothetical protein
MILRKAALAIARNADTERLGLNQRRCLKILGSAAPGFRVRHSFPPWVRPQSDICGRDGKKSPETHSYTFYCTEYRFTFQVKNIVIHCIRLKNKVFDSIEQIFTYY